MFVDFLTAEQYQSYTKYPETLTQDHQDKNIYRAVPAKGYKDNGHRSDFVQRLKIDGHASLNKTIEIRIELVST